MKKIIFFVATIATLAITSCSKDDVANDNGVKYVTGFTAEFENSTRVDATYTGSGLSFKFADGDIVTVWNVTDGTICTEYKYDITTKKFIPKSSEVPKMVDGQKYFLTYKCNGDSNTTPSFVNGILTTTKKMSAELGDVPLISDIFEANVNGTFATFHHLFGMLEIPVTITGGKTISNVYLMNDLISPYFQVKFAESGLISESVITTTNKNDSYISYAVNNVINRPENTYLFPIAPGEYQSLSLHYKVGNVTKSISIPIQSLTVERGVIRKKATPVEIRTE